MLLTPGVVWCGQVAEYSGLCLGLEAALKRGVRSIRWGHDRPPAHESLHVWLPSCLTVVAGWAVQGVRGLGAGGQADDG